ncbi:RNA polymerase sigma-70 factor [Pedobacter sp. BS3]|uniref:RNA polymerase sigma-70 factor n=1 Tax=Pedobacter sp. BS3 TaxID=2567937 RepID=UPI0011EC554A|nr:RNA polymerase sigma-70 factor [Pedobacter sp. BS3]TZF83274.1 RNA polymerase sigma-70 factor [Pedobacter sp. BS3]
MQRREDTNGDETLLENLKKGNRDAFEKIYLKYWDKLYSSVYKRVKITEVAEEIVQDFFVSLWEKRAQITVHTSFEAYIFTAVRYQVLNYLQKEMTRNNYKAGLSIQETYSNTTLDQVYMKELDKVIESEISQLPDKCQHVFRLSRQENLSIKEIAEKLEISTKTVENHLTKALRILRISLKDYMVASALLFYLYK